MQVITNLLTNAIKYSEKGTEVYVRIVEKKSEVIIEVQDFGRGIDKANFNAIFGRFFQIEDEANPLLDGLGIGLYITSEIVKRHNGKIWVESTVGKGSTFFVSLPKNK
jgi:signal transduction histidine kinase